ncbi:MAG: ABC transporter substrate-binding protein [Arenicellales bacterium]|jgi:NitT/TauT family transport system substrate-binding protein|nr:ABC transporter substrate-binding protein [Arenicellales bacterium]
MNNRTVWIRGVTRLTGVLCGLLLLSQVAIAGEIRLGVLKFGTVNWELDVMAYNGLASAEGVDLTVVPLANKNATSVALQADEVDMIVTDWIWVSRQRAAGADFTFAPYSRAVGGLMVPADSDITSLSHLADRRVGIAGGPVDKSWVLFKALAQTRYALDLDKEVDRVFGAPPLISQQVLAGDVDAAVNFWHYNARLKAAGLREVISVEDAIQALGISGSAPMLGYAFRADWAREHREDVIGFLRASRATKALLASSTDEWQRLRPRMKASEDEVFDSLITGYRAGIPSRWGEPERRAAARLFAVMAEAGGKKLVGESLKLTPGTFWPEWSF